MDLVRHKRQHHEKHLFGRMQAVVTGDDPEVGEEKKGERGREGVEGSRSG